MSMQAFKHETVVWNNKESDFKRVQVLIEIDFEKLAKHLAHKAIRNKSRRTKMLQGAVTLSLASLLESA